MSKIVADRPVPELTEAAWREIESTIELKERSRELRERVMEYYQSSYVTKDAIVWVPYLLPDPVRSRHMRKALKTLAQLARQLGDLLALDHGKASEANPEEYARFLSVRLIWGVDKKMLETTLRQIQAKAEDAISELPADRGGPRADSSFLAFVNQLGDLYKDVTGKPGGRVSWDELSKQNGGPFFRFVEAICRHLLPPEARRSNNALGQAIKRAFDKSYTE
jgi:hypothetical protein